MKIGHTPGPNRTEPVRRTDKAGEAAAAYGARTPRRITDTVSILGIPPEDMTPKVHSAIMTLMEEVETLRREVEAANKRLRELEELADRDTLTPTPNRRAFVRELSRMISFADRYGAPSSLIYLDINDLKVINDTHGHAAGDRALVHVADLLTTNVRGSDFVGRLGGDEFGILLAQADEEAALEKAGSLARAIEQTPFDWQGHSLTVGVAYGAHTFQAGEDPTAALALADRRMYDQKRSLKSEAAS